MVQETKVFKSKKEFKDYLKTLKQMPEAFNRPVGIAHSKKMGESIKEIGLQRPINVIKTKAFSGVEELYIADGQHLRDSILSNKLMNLGSHLVSFENEIEGVDKIIPFISRMNSTAKNWSLKNYLDAWTTQKVPNYVFLTEKFESLDISLSGVLECFVVNRQSDVEAYKNGKVQIDESKGNTIIRAYNEACAVGLNRNPSSLLATARFFKSQGQLPAETFVNSISNNANTFKHKLNRDGYLGLFKNFVKK